MFPVRRQISPHTTKLRQNATDVEQRLWQMLRNRQLDGWKFRRQVTLDRYIVDFLCMKARLVIELDGGQHDAEVDAPRTRWLEGEGYIVLRFWNHEMVENLDGVMEAIRIALQKKTLTQPSPAKAGEGQEE